MGMKIPDEEYEKEVQRSEQANFNGNGNEEQPGGNSKVGRQITKSLKDR